MYVSGLVSGWSQKFYLPFFPLILPLSLSKIFCRVHRARNRWSSFFSFRRERHDKVNIGMSECKKRKEKKIAQQPEAIANRAGGTLPAEIETTGYKVTSFDSQYVTFLHSHELDSEEWPHYMQLHHQLHMYRWRDRRERAGEGEDHFSTMLALILLEIEYSYKREREGRPAKHPSWLAIKWRGPWRYNKRGVFINVYLRLPILWKTKRKRKKNHSPEELFNTDEST